MTREFKWYTRKYPFDMQESSNRRIEELKKLETYRKVGNKKSHFPGRFNCP